MRVSCAVGPASCGPIGKVPECEKTTTATSRLHVVLACLAGRVMPAWPLQSGWVNIEKRVTNDGRLRSLNYIHTCPRVVLASYAPTTSAYEYSNAVVLGRHALKICASRGFVAQVFRFAFKSEDSTLRITITHSFTGLPKGREATRAR